MKDNILYLSLIITSIIVFLIGIMYISIKTGWISFSMTNGQNFYSNFTPIEKIADLRFDKCIYTISHTGFNGMTGPTSYSRDITNQLNYMISAYKYIENINGDGTNGYAFKLEDPGLSQYSFIIPGFSDYETLQAKGCCAKGPSGPTGPCHLPAPWANTGVHVTIEGRYK